MRVQGDGTKNGSVLKNGWQRFRSTPYWVQSVIWVLFGLFVGLTSGDDSQEVTTRAAEPTRTSVVTETVYQCADGTERSAPCPRVATTSPPTTAPPTTTPPPPPTTAAPVGPATSFRDGLYEVGRDIKAGTYRTSGGTSFCYWDIEDEPNGNILDQGVSTGGPQIMKASNGTFVESQGCGTWTLS